MSFILHPRSKEEVDEMIAVMKRARKKICRSKASARKFLIEGGFITKDGKPTKMYGG